jgi:hypothetical protein
MSWWIKRKDEQGKTHLWAVDVDPLLFMMLLSLLLAFIIPSLSRVSTVLMFSGFLCFLIAKVSLFREGVWISWGSSRMGKGYTILYRVGYGLMLAGIFLRLLLYVLSLVK